MFVHSFSAFAFILGRERDLSASELASVLPTDASVIASERESIIVEGLTEEVARRLFLELGGSTRLIGVLGSVTHVDAWSDQIVEDISSRENEKKFPYALASYWKTLPLMRLGLTVKRKVAPKSVRLANTSEAVINSASYKKNITWVGKEYVLLATRKRLFSGITLECQDVDAWSERDLSRERNARVGMLPPKLARMMLSLAGHASSVWDPFVGLGTVLTEARSLWVQRLIGSDFSTDMVRATRDNLRLTEGEVFQLDARDIFQKKDLLATEGLAVVTEGYLWTPMHAGNAWEEAIFSEQRIVSQLYEAFLAALYDGGFRGCIVMSAPVWRTARGQDVSLDLSDMAQRTGWQSDSILPQSFSTDGRARVSVVYRRDGQIVGREIRRFSPRLEGARKMLGKKPRS